MSQHADFNRMTADQYFDTFSDTTHPMELIDGEVIVLRASRPTHQDIVLNLALLIGNFIKPRRCGRLQLAPSDLQLDEYNVVQPDLFYVALGNQSCWIGEHGYFQGTPDMCIEVFSAQSMKRDRMEKFDLYEKYGVKEYWLVEPELRFVEVYVLENGRYQREGAFDEGDSFISVVLPELTVKVVDIFPPEMVESSDDE